MLVKDLIRRLGRCDPDAKVYVQVGDGEEAAAIAVSDVTKGVMIGGEEGVEDPEDDAMSVDEFLESR